MHLIDSRFRDDNLLFTRQMLYPIELYLPTATCYLSCCRVFWTRQYNTPRSFRLASYSEVLHDPVEDKSPPRTDRTAFKPLVAKPWTGTLPFLVPVDWLVSSEVGTTRYSPVADVPCISRRLSHRSFHYTSVLVSSTRFLNEACLTAPSRLALVDQKWRTTPGAGL